MIDIKDTSNNIRFSTEINTGSKRKFTLMQEDYITLRFSVADPVYFKLGDHIDTELGLFELVDLYKPTLNESTGGYDYELRLDAYYWKWKNKMFKFAPEVGGNEASWKLTSTLDVHLGVFLRNLSALGYKYKGQNFEFKIDNTVSSSSKLIVYENTNLIDALTQMAETWECEWWMEDNQICFGRCEFGDPVDFEIGNNVERMERSESKATFATRVYAFGSTRNLPINYRPVDENIVVGGIVQKRLMLPVGVPFVDAYQDMTTEEAVEDVVVFDDIYPRRTGTMSSVTPVEKTENIENIDGTTTQEKFNVYQFKDTGITFSKDYILAGEELRIVFQSGALSGMDFGVIFNPNNKPEKLEDGSWNPDAQLWEIVRNEDYGRMLPGDSLVPKNGDTYNLYGFDSTSAVFESMVSNAEKELEQAAKDYVKKTKIDPNTYSCTMMSDYMYNEGDDRVNEFTVGAKIKLINPAYFETGRVSRVIGYEFDLDIPYSSTIFTIGETASYSRISDLEQKVEELTYKGQIYTGTGAGVYIIGTNDNTSPTNKNVYSALKVLREFVRYQGWVDQPLRTFDDVKFKSLQSTEFESRVKGWIIDALGDAEFRKLILREGFKTADFIPGVVGAGTGMVGTEDFTTGKLTVRNYMEVMALAVAQVFWRGGRDVHSPSGMKVNKVKEYPDYWRCYMDTSEGQVNTCTIGAQMRCDNYGDNKKKYYWNLVTGVGEDYIDLSKTDRDGVDIPEVGDELAQFGHRTDPNLSWILVISSIMEDAGMTMYAGVNGYTLSKKWAIRVGKDPDGDNRIGVFTKNGEMSDVIEGLEGKVQDATDKVDNLQIGGTNLIDQFDAGGLTAWFPSDSTAKVSVNNGIIRGEYVGIADAHYPRVCNKSVRKIVLDLESEYTVSFKIRSNKALEVAYGLSDSNSDNRVMPQVYTPELSENFIEVKNTFKPLKQITSGNIFYIYITLDFGAGKTAWIEVKDVKIEKGNKATDFSYSLADQELIAKEQGLIGGQEAVDGLQIGSVNLISRKMMLAWNEKNKDIAVWGQDADGVYLSVNPSLLRSNIAGGDNFKDIFLGEGNYKPNTQYVFSMDWKTATTEATDKNGLYLRAIYTDGTEDYILRASNQQTSKTRTDHVTAKGKTIQKISSTYGHNINCLIYSLGLFEGNKPLPEIPVATEDITGQSNVNLVDGGKEIIISKSIDGNYNRAELSTNGIKPNSVYTVSFGSINVLDGNPTEFTIGLRDIKNDNWYSALHMPNGDRTALIITPNRVYEKGISMWIYAGRLGSTAGNSVKFSEVMLVEGFTAPSSYSPSPGDMAKDIKDVSDAVSNLSTTINGAFKDGIIDEAEAKAIASNINILNAEKADIDNAYTPLYDSPYLLSGTTAVTNLYNTKTAYNTAHADLISAINTAIADNKVTSTEKANVDAKFTAYSSALGTYKKRVEEANRAIQDRIKELAELDATNKVDNIQVGGTNLFPISKLNPVSYKTGSSKEGFGPEIIFKCNTPSTWAILPVSIPKPLVPANTDFIVSMDIRNTNGFGFEVTATSGTPTIPGMGLVKFENTTNEWKRIVRKLNSGSNTNIGGINLWGVGDVRHIKIEFGNKATDWSPSPEDVDQAIQDAIAKTVDVTAPSQVFKYGAGYTGTPTPASIVLTAIPRNFTPTSYQWQYLNGSTWTNISGATGSTYSVSPGNTTFFPSGTNVRTFRCICNGDEKLSDSFTLAKLADGATGSKGDKGDKGDTGTAGKGIKSITNYYLASASSSGVTVSTSGWTTTIQTISTSKRYLWNYEVVTYTDNSTTTTTPVIIGVYGNTGATGSTGAAGRGITSITEYYAVSSSNTTAPTSWATTVPTTTTTNKYLWNYEKITYTDSTTEETTKRVIGTHGATGSTGAAGKDAYTVLLGNESHAFAGSTAAALAGSTTCGVTAYKGATQVDATIGTITGLPAGMTASVASNGTTAPVITFTVTTSMKTASGTVNIPVTVDGKVFTKVFSYSIAFKGATGATGAQGIPGESINGKMLFKDSEFKLGLNGVVKYTNSPNVAPDYIKDKLTVERIAKPSDAPTQSGYCLKVTCKAAQSPGYGGVAQYIQSRANAVFVQKIIAKIDVGYTINAASNSMGSGYKDEWLTSRAGTGKYETYLRKVTCGASGSFSTGGHIYLTGSPAPTESVPLEWYIASMTCYDQTEDGYADIEIVTKDSLAVQLGFTNFEALKANALTKGPLIKAGLINADVIDVNTLAGKTVFADKLLTNTAFMNSVKANTLDVGGFTIQDHYIIGGSDIGAGAGGIKITSTDVERSFKTYKDASNYISMYYNSANDWGLKGVVEGSELLKLGTKSMISGWEMSTTGFQSSDFVQPTWSGSAISGGKGSKLFPDGGIMLMPSGTGILPLSSGVMQAGLIKVEGDNSMLVGLEIVARGNGYLKDIVALKLSAMNDYSSPSKYPTALEIASGDFNIYSGGIYMKAPWNNLSMQNYSYVVGGCGHVPTSIRQTGSTNCYLDADQTVVLVNNSQHFNVFLPDARNLKPGHTVKFIPLQSSYSHGIIADSGNYGAKIRYKNSLYDWVYVNSVSGGRTAIIECTYIGIFGGYRNWVAGVLNQDGISYGSN